ncbi:cell divisionftsk/spoiiie [gamma proteobacterium HTCC5015]|nr:cell divisionftsk/spoiiie [gamma proteobacterium HTCC5015]
MSSAKKSAATRGAARKVKAKRTLSPWVKRRLLESALCLLVALAVYVLLVLWSYDPSDSGFSHTGPRDRAANLGGIIGAHISDLLLWVFGYLAYLVPIMGGYSAWLMVRTRSAERSFDGHLLAVRWVGFVMMVVSGCGLAGIHFSVNEGALPAQLAGGLLGQQVGFGLVDSLNIVGTTVLLLALFLASIPMFTGISWLKVIDYTGRYALLAGHYALQVSSSVMDRWRDRRQYSKARQERKELFEEAQKEVKERKAKAPKRKIEPKMAPEKRVSEREFKEQQIPLFEAPPNTELPPISLLDDPKEQTFGYSAEALEAMSDLLEHKLNDFNVTAEVVNVLPGPVITRFEIQPAPGTKASKITGLSKDLARSMSVVSVRVVEVIPGKSVVGIEIPNETREIISFQEIMRSKSYEKLKSPLAIGLGKDISGVPVSADLGKMPHLLVAGTTGSGKSVAINAMLLSLLYKATAEEVRLILIDPKMLELNVYEGIPHLLCPVVTDMKDATNALRWSVGEMERRYKLMSQLGVRNLAGYNRKVREAINKGEPISDPMYKREEAFDPDAPPPTLEPMSHIVIIIDEFADMMMVVGKKAEELIARLAQKARAAGIHMILATQRPSVDVITGLIKANVPTRIAFQVSSRVDSRTILDQMGAEQLLGHGDMLYYQPGVTNTPERVHGAFVDDHEVHEVVEHLKRTSGEPEYIDSILEESSEPLPGMSPEAAGGGGEELDPLYDQAVRVVTESRKASISYVQRRLKVGYNRAASMLEVMEEQGVVTKAEGNGSREVLAPPPPPAD